MSLIICQSKWHINDALNHLQSRTCNCWATQLLGAPTLLEDSQRYIPESVLDTLFNFCSKQRWRASFFLKIKTISTKLNKAFLILPIVRLSIFSPAFLSSCRWRMECPPWLSEPCCLCTSDTLLEGRWVCPYSEAPAQSPQTPSSAHHRRGREAALRGHRGRTDEEEWTQIICYH